MSEPVRHLDALAGARVVVIGDVMLDRYVFGRVERISPEAPIPVLRVDHELEMLGGAGNVARNLVALGVGAALVGVVGDDEAGRGVTALAAAETGLDAALVASRHRRTGVKVRYVAGAQQLLRADAETVAPLGEDDAERLCAAAEQAMAGAGAVVFSDYGKGALAPPVLRRLIDSARGAGAHVVVDPKGGDVARYAGCDVLTPNRQELAALAGAAVDDDEKLIAAAQQLRAAARLGAVLVTRGADGMTLVADGGARHVPALAQEVFDVSGAGDTVAATVAALLAAGAPLEDAVEIANIAAGIVVGKLGTAVARAEEIRQAAQRRDLIAPVAKVAGRDAAAERVRRWRAEGRRVGFTNGCFDLLHPGHLALIDQARRACDRLVVAINSDESTRRLKGAGRPVQNAAARAAVLAALGQVDLVVVFDEDTPLSLIAELKPDVLVKGADYRRDQVVGGDVVESYGGRVVLADLVPGHSTTGTIARLNR